MGMGWARGSQLRLTLWAPLRWAALRSSGRWGVVRGAWGGPEPGEGSGGNGGRSPPSYEYGRGGRGGTESDSYTSHRMGKWRTLLPGATTNPKQHKRLSGSTAQVNTLVLSICVCLCARLHNDSKIMTYFTFMQVWQRVCTRKTYKWRRWSNVYVSCIITSVVIVNWNY